MNIVTIKEGKHSPGLKLNGLFPMRVNAIDLIKIEFRFFEDTRYVIIGDDWHDWNKLGGIVFNPFRRSKDTILAGWRYNPLTKKFDVTAYQNNDYTQNSGYGEGQSLAHYELGERGKVEIRKQHSSFYYQFFKIVNGEWKTLQAIEVRKTTRKKFKWAFRSSLWFGGNNKAPNEIKMQHGIKYR